jgi:hypothetical protein
MYRSTWEAESGGSGGEEGGIGKLLVIINGNNFAKTF